MDEKPILFNSKMVNAIISGRKTQTRRVINPQPNEDGLSFDKTTNQWVDTNGTVYKCPYGRPDDRLWVRETWQRSTIDLPDGIVYRADNLLIYFDNSPLGTQAKQEAEKKNLPRDGKLRPSIFMPRWASRLYLRVENIRCERIQYIRAYECVEEGVNPSGHDPCDIADSAHDKFKILWNSINEKRGFGWKENPFVWAVKFSCVEKNG